MKKIISALFSFALVLTATAQTQEGTTFDPAAHSTFTTTRSDGRYLSSRAIAHRLMELTPPRLHYNDSLRGDALEAWREDVGATMARLMNHPDLKDQPAPIKVGTWQRDGYRIEKWESYPLPDAVVPYLVLIPDGVNATNPAPAILCIPGSGQTKELLAGESSVDLNKSEAKDNRNAQAYKFAKEGYIAVAVDNGACGENGDLERTANSSGWDYVNFSRALLELDWNYLGYCSYVDKVILDWMKTQPEMRSDRLVVSGFSLGTEPLMALGVMDPSIYAFVYNDFLCTTRERALAMTLPDMNGRRWWPNDISHLIPGFLTEFDFPDIVAALSPRPVICTEGGLDRDFDMIHRAYEAAGAPEAFVHHHYAKYAPDSMRLPVDTVPYGINRDTFFRLANVDSPNHYFKAEHILPWLREILKKE